MKTFTTTILFLTIIALTTNGQDYQAVRPEVESCFNNKYGLINCLRIDSVLDNPTATLYPAPSHLPIDYNCFSPSIGSWIGKKIIIKESGENIFLNHANDSVRINTQAALEDSWLAWEGSGGVKIIATVVEHKLMDFLEVTDSVKIIAFQAYNSNDEPLQMNINDMQIVLSKLYGLIQTLNFYYFPNFSSWSPYNANLHEHTLVGLSNPLMGLKNFGWFDVYDFQPNDVLHVLRKNGVWVGQSTGYFNITETRKAYKYLERIDYNDSIFYRYSLRQVVYKDWLNYTAVSHDTLTVMIKPNKDFDNLPEEPAIEYYGDSGSYDYFTMRENEHIIKTKGNTWYVKDDANCWEEWHYDGVPLEIYYMKGLGGPYYPYAAMFGGSLGEELVYYEKEGVIWGTPLIMTNIETIANEDFVSIFPNPVKDVLTISLDASNTGTLNLRLINIHGSDVINPILLDGITMIDVSKLPQGLYFCVITQNNRIFYSRKIIKQ
ncbi:MAG: T9SS type A sorting domain-containing protein [Bacteroidetes bacterium]|nr:T9SS type A sorting domain-containing protein [Bacteroidota bacterium]